MLMNNIISIFFLGTCLGLLQSEKNIMDMDERLLLNIYHLETSSNCSDKWGLYDFERSVIRAISYVRSLVPPSNKTSFFANLHGARIPGCSIQEEDRSLLLAKYLKDIKAKASINEGYTVFLGPPHQRDCNLVNAWISGGSPEETRHQQLYQISYFCPLIGHNAVFNTHLADSTSSQLTTPISAVAIVPSHVNILRGLRAYLITKGWRNIAIFYEPLSYKYGNLGDLMRSIPIPLITVKLEQWAIIIHQNQPIYFGMNFTSLLSKFEDYLDAVVIMANPTLAVEFLIGAQNVHGVKAGSIAIIQTNPTDMFTYDSLRNWRAVLSVAPPTLSAGRSLIILNVLPFGTLYDDNSYIYQERINIAVANAAAVAMRLVQINLEAGDGNLMSATGLFKALKYHKILHVPTVPNITFTYKIDQNINLEGIYEMLFFALTPKVTENTLESTNRSDFNDIFYQIDVIKYPQILPWKLADMKWPGDGKGPSKYRCLAVACDFFSMRFVWVIFFTSFLYALILYACVLYAHRWLSRKRRSKTSLRLIYFEEDFTLKDDDLTSPCENMNENGFCQGEYTGHIPIHTCPTGFVYLDEDPVYIKQLGVPRFPWHGKMTQYLDSLRELRHLNINTFVGCCLIADKFSFVYDFCQRGSLQDIIRNQRINMDHIFKFSLIADLVQGMEYLHSSSIKVHGCLKATNCVISARWILKITGFGIPMFYSLMDLQPKIETEDKLWMAPELLRDCENAHEGTRAGDIYSFAIASHQVLYQCEPYGRNDIPAEEIIARVASKESPPFRPEIKGEEFSPDYLSILEACMHENPDLRPSFKYLKDEFQRMHGERKVSVVEHMIKQLEKCSACLEKQVEKRKKELESENKKQDILISRMLPPTVSAALLVGIKVAPETFDEVSIYFSDIVGFTTISAMSTPLQVIELLNDLYTLFDQVIANYDVYKVETIGDAYMVASGLPIRNGHQHASEIAFMALDLLSSCGTFIIKHLPKIPLRIRIGLHSGPCVAGVVGLAMPRYCLFGNTVSCAQKMESSGAAFRIHISQSLKELLDDIGGFTVEYSGVVEFDGGSKALTYWLCGSSLFQKPLPKPPPLIGGENHW
nr:retinal guanylyl cyclase 2 [Hymenolepis microstoma]